jgi:hypothetical protein
LKDLKPLMEGKRGRNGNKLKIPQEESVTHILLDG